MGSIGKIINGECKEFADDTDVVVISKEVIEQTPITFEESITLANIQSGDTLSVVLGKLSKLYSVLETGMLSGGGTTRKQLEVNGELIGENNVHMSVYGDLRIINGYIRITVPIKKGDTLVYIDPEDSPPVPQWSTSTHFAKPGEVRSGSMNLTILQGATNIYINDDYPVSIGMYNIDFVYTVT